MFHNIYPEFFLMFPLTEPHKAVWSALSLVELQFADRRRNATYKIFLTDSYLKFRAWLRLGSNLIWSLTHQLFVCLHLGCGFLGARCGSHGHGPQTTGIEN